MREIVLFGTGYQAEKFVFEYGKIYDIKYCLDFQGGKKFLGKYEVYEPTAENCSKFFIICAGDYYMSKVRTLLEKYGKKELVDYIWYEWDNKKMVAINANCYGPHIKNYLRVNPEFEKNFYFYPVPTIHQNKAGTIDEHVMKNCDIFLHQDVRADNSFGYKLSDEYLIPQLPKKAKSITIPNLVGFGKIFFRQALSDNQFNRPWPNTPFGLFPHGDEVIDKMCEENFSVEYIVKKCKTSRVFTKEEVEASLNKIYMKFKEREQSWDIKILDYIMTFYREKKVFYDAVHPSNFVMRKICEDILKELGITSKLPLAEKSLDSFEIPVYPDIKEILGLEWGGEFEVIRTTSPYKLRECEMDMEEFIREYVYWCHPEQFWKEEK